ncbi:MAG: Stealth CR1 domain-containing protein [Lachnospiraceae bacterium]|nr:Stealth CR1 domain-containing protein [Lachnospiraceae bacterium]
MQPLISVILPIYNIEKYLPECMESVFAQTYKNLEIIMIDDGSPDGCPALCDKYEKRDSRVVVYHKENGGLSDARNYGILRAKGEYITCIDPDDYVDEDYVEYLYALICKYGTKMSICQHRVHYDNGSVKENGSEGSELLRTKTCLKRMLYHDVIDTSAWAKLYHKSLFEEILYPKGKIFEDIGTTYALMMQCGSIAVGYESKYNYIFHQQSIVNGTFHANKFDLISMTDKMAKDVLSVYPDLDKAILRRRVYARFSTLNQMLNTDEYPKEKKKIIQFIKKNWKNILCDRSAPNRDKLGLILLGFNYNLYRACWLGYQSHIMGDLKRKRSNNMKKKKRIEIDFVIPWVDGNDEVWQKKKMQYDPKAGTDAGVNRYRDWETLKYWFRGVEKFAPWVHHIYFVSDEQVPEWLDLSHPKLTWIDHKDYIPEKYLPTFNANPIELNFHRIKGLSEHFVYFNDDFFLIRPIKPTFFFKKGLPCDDAILSPIIMEGKHSPGKMCSNNMGVINEYFDKKVVLRSNITKWISPCYGKYLLRTFCLIPWHHISGFYNDHLPQAFLKSTYREVWNNEFELLDEVCTHKFRDYTNDVNQWLLRYWQLCKGQFMPISPRRGVCFNDVCEDALETIRKQKCSVICINDNEEKDFEGSKKALHSAFEEILPEKSKFEK